MSRFTSYYLYQKYEKVGDGEWTPTYPNEYSISGDTENTMPLVIKSENDTNCGYRDPIYRWADTEDTICVYEVDHDYSQDYLTIESLEDNNEIYWKASDSSITKTISASTDNGQTWTAYTSSTGGSGTTIATLNANDKLLLKGINNTYAEATTVLKYNNFLSSKEFIIYGNIMSLTYNDNFENQISLLSKAQFAALFWESKKLKSAKNLILPATILTDTCYFRMFRDCTNLTTAPELPATTLKYSCYNGMFRGCTSLTTAPELPASDLVELCYMYMFYNCSNLKYIKALFTKKPNSDYTMSWVSGVSSTGTFVKAANATWNVIGPNGIPSGWTVQNA